MNFGQFVYLAMAQDFATNIVSWTLPIVGIIVFIFSIFLIKDRKFRELGGLLVMGAIVIGIGYMVTSGWFQADNKIDKEIQNIIPKVFSSPFNLK